MDVEDEELSFVKATNALDPFAYIREHGVLPSFNMLGSKTSTQLAVGMAQQFDGVTVSNVALQNRYGGRVISHVRPANRFQPSKERSVDCRQTYGVPPVKYGVLFYCSPGKHKDVTDTGRVIPHGRPASRCKSSNERCSACCETF